MPFFMLFAVSFFFSRVFRLRKEGEKAFKRPFLLPVDLDSRLAESDVAWYMALAETAWATWPPDFHTPDVAPPRLVLY